METPFQAEREDRHPMKRKRSVFFSQQRKISSRIVKSSSKRRELVPKQNKMEAPSRKKAHDLVWNSQATQGCLAKSPIHP
jgi:hypothetical protein